MITDCLDAKGTPGDNIERFKNPCLEMLEIILK